jgi:hypothetical protein
MKKVILIFPDINALSDFIQDYLIPGVEVNTLHLSLTGVLTERQVEDACNNYLAILSTTMPFPDAIHQHRDAPGSSAKPSPFLTRVPTRAN